MVIIDTPPMYDNHHASISNRYNTVFKISQNAINIGIVFKIYRKTLYKAFLLFKSPTTPIPSAVLDASLCNHRRSTLTNRATIRLFLSSHIN